MGKAAHVNAQLRIVGTRDRHRHGVTSDTATVASGATTQRGQFCLAARSDWRPIGSTA
jgi:hypothetical protein